MTNFLKIFEKYFLKFCNFGKSVMVDEVIIKPIVNYFAYLSRPGVKNNDRMHWCGLPVWQLLFSDVEPVTSVITGE